MFKRILALVTFTGLFLAAGTLAAANSIAQSLYTYDAYDAWFTKAVNYTENMPFEGENVTVAVIDTGIDGKHPVLQENVVDGFDAANFKSIPASVSSDRDGHGTHVAGIIRTFAPKVSLMPVRIFGSAFGGLENPIASGIYWAADNGADVINMSLATTLEFGVSNIEDICNAASYAIEKEVVVVAAAGNNGLFDNPQIFPSACGGVISVAAVNEELKPAWFSSYDSTVVLAAPGSNIVSTVPYEKAVNHNVLGYNSFSGTSMASPIVAAAAALLLDSGVEPDNIKNVLVASADDVSPPGYDPFTGHGVVNFAKMFNNNTPATPQPTAIEIVSTYAENGQGYVNFRPSFSLVNPSYVAELFNVTTQEAQIIPLTGNSVRATFDITETDLTLVRIVDLTSNTASAYSMIPNTAFFKRSEVPLELDLDDIFNIPVKFTKKSYSDIKDYAFMPIITKNGYFLKIIIGGANGVYEVSSPQYPKISTKITIDKAYGSGVTRITEKEYIFFSELEDYWKVNIEKI